MVLSVDKSVICPIVVDRESEIASLAWALEQACADHGQTILLAGEAGVGKSRLVAAARAHADGLGFLYLQGQPRRSHSCGRNRYA